MIGWLYIGLVILIIFGLIRATVYNKSQVIEDDLDYAFEDMDGNLYAAIDHRGQKILLKIPDEVETFLNSNRKDRTWIIDEAERKAKRGLLEKIIINGAVGYLAKGKEIKETIKESNKRNER